MERANNPSLPALGVSSCLLGECTRYDGGHKRDRYITGTLGRLFRLVAVCPEVECGMPTPREPMRLEGDPGCPRLVTLTTRIDRTEQMLAYCRARVEELENEELCGFIFKSRSPSCGLSGVEVFGDGKLSENDRGLFAAAVVARFPRLPVEEEGRLNDLKCREEFIERVFGYSRPTERITADE